MALNGNTSETLNLNAIASLPSTSEQLDALSKNGLIRSWAEGEWNDGLTILNGKVITNDAPGRTTKPFPYDVLNISKDHTLSQQVGEVIFGQNRVLLEGQLDKSLEFFQTHIQWVKYIKRLDVKFNLHNTFNQWNKGARESWQQLAMFIATELRLEDLDLSLDAGPTYEDLLEMRLVEEDLVDSVPHLYTEVVDILAEALAGKKPSSLFIYWVAFFDMETEGEKKIMGSNYDSEKLGKIPHTRRTPWYPHGAPTEELEYKDGFKLE